jgi:hypothetical protein
MACTPPCGMAAALNSLDEMIWSILSRYADTTDDTKLRFGRSEVEIRNGLVNISPDSEEDSEKVVSILKHHFRVHEIAD